MGIVSTYYCTVIYLVFGKGWFRRHFRWANRTKVLCALLFPCFFPEAFFHSSVTAAVYTWHLLLTACRFTKYFEVLRSSRHQLVFTFEASDIPVWRRSRLWRWAYVRTRTTTTSTIVVSLCIPNHVLDRSKVVNSARHSWFLCACVCSSH